MGNKWSVRTPEQVLLCVPRHVMTGSYKLLRMQIGPMFGTAPKRGAADNQEPSADHHFLSIQ